MCWKAMDAVMKMEGLDEAEFRVMMALAYRKNPITGLCNPAYETIADDSRSSRATIARVMARLKAKGMLSWVTVGNGLKDKSNHYTLHLVSPGDLVGADQVSNELAPSLKNSLTKSQKRANQVSSYETVTGFNRSLTDDSNRHAADAEAMHLIEKNKIQSPSTLEDAKRLFDVWNSFQAVRKYNPPKKWLEGDYPDASLMASIVCWISSNADWEQRLQQVKEEYANSKFLQNGGSSGQLNSLSWLFSKDGVNIEAVLSGKYRDKQPSQPVLYFIDKQNLKADGSTRESRGEMLSRWKAAGFKLPKSIQ